MSTVTMQDMGSEDMVSQRGDGPGERHWGEEEASVQKCGWAGLREIPKELRVEDHWATP